MLDFTPTSCMVNDLQIREALAKSERLHDLTRDSAKPARPAAFRFAIQWPRISLVSRLMHRQAQNA